MKRVSSVGTATRGRMSVLLWIDDRYLATRFN